MYAYFDILCHLWYGYRTDILVLQSAIHSAKCGKKKAVEMKLIVLESNNFILHAFRISSIVTILTNTPPFKNTLTEQGIRLL